MRLEDRGKNLWATFTADMARYAGPDVRPWSLPFLRRLLTQSYVHPGLLAVVVYRYGQWVAFRCHVPVLRQVCDLLYYVGFAFARFVLQIELPRTSAIDAGLRIDHYGSILVNCQIIAGKNLTITHGVVVGQTDTGVPRLGDNVDCGVGAKLIGGIELGDNVQVGAGAVVTKSFEANAVVAGVPARLLRYRANPAQETSLPPAATPPSESPERLAVQR
jgi:serine O-acetyltransferase